MSDDPRPVGRLRRRRRSTTLERARFERHLAELRRLPGRGRPPARGRRRPDRRGHRRRARRPRCATGCSPRSPPSARCPPRPAASAPRTAPAASPPLGRRRLRRRRRRWPCSASAPPSGSPGTTTTSPTPTAAEQVLNAPRRRRGDADLPRRRQRDAGPLRVRAPGRPGHRGHAGRPRAARSTSCGCDVPGEGMVSAGRDAAQGRPDGAARRATPPPPPRAGITVEPAGGSPAADRRPDRAVRLRRAGAESHDRPRYRRAACGHRLRRRRADRRLRARRASRRVTLFEADARLGGHADTHQVGDLAIDTGFIVHNERTYPVLLRIFAELGVAHPGLRDVDVGARRAHRARVRRRARRRAGCSRRPRNLREPGVPADARRDPPLPPPRPGRLLAGDGRATTETFGGVPRPRPASRRTSAGTSPSRSSPPSGPATPTVALEYPARYLFRFLDHHGMLGGLRLAAVEDGDRRIARVRRPGRRRARRRPHRHQGHLGPRDRRRRRGHRRQRRHHDVRRRRRRHPPRPGPGDAGRADTRCSARSSARCRTPRNTAHLHTDTSLLPRRRERPGVVELPAPAGHAAAGSPSPTT